MYEPIPIDDSELCQPVEEADFETLHTLINGKRRRKKWRPVAMKVINRDRGKTLAYSDSPWWMSNALIFRPAAVEKLESILLENGELLPVGGSAAGLSIWNPTNVIDALDRKRSEIWTFDDGRLMHVVRYAFRSRPLKNLDVFKIPDFRVSPTFVSERFVQQWKKAGLRGLKFKKVWP